jgi:hypothetical protein
VVSDVQVNGVNLDMLLLQAGTFTDSSSSLGLSSGIILGTGDVTLAESPNLGGGSSLPGNAIQCSDSDLESLSAFSVNDQIVLEFDFIALGSEVWSNYVFASEE